MLNTQRSTDCPLISSSSRYGRQMAQDSYKTVAIPLALTQLTLVKTSEQNKLTKGEKFLMRQCIAGADFSPGKVNVTLASRE